MKSTPYSPLAWADVKDIKTVVKNSRGANKADLDSCLAQVLSRVSLYRASISSNGCTGIAMPSTVADRYYNLYESNASGVSSIKRLARKAFETELLCPYCSVDTYTCLDHYLPRSAFPEYSISSQNLVPSCFSCNTTHKGQKWGSGANRKFIHPYFDTLPLTSRYLYSHVLVHNGVFNIDFMICIGTTIPLGRVIHSHFQEMRLRDRYIAQATSVEIPKMRNIVNSSSGPNDRQSRLHEYIHQQLQAYRMNTWQHAFYEAMQSNVVSAAQAL